MNDFTVVPMTRDIADVLCDAILYLEQFVHNVGGPNWTRDNVLKELPRKWELSFLVLDNQHNIAGYTIASEREGNYHIHRPFLHPEYRFKLTGFLVKQAARIAQEHGFKQISWKSSTRIVGFDASQRMADRKEYIGTWDNADFYYFYRRLNNGKQQSTETA